VTQHSDSDLWRIALVADAASQAAYAAALEEICDSISAFESKPGGAWRIEGLATVEPDRIALAARLAVASAETNRAVPPLDIERMPQIDWLAENRRSFPPLKAGRYFIYGSHYQGEVPAGAHAVTLDAGIAFGSGEHATTRGCLLALDRHGRRASVRRALDVGCGSGILAIAMAKTWPLQAVASDIDRASVRVAAENARRNAVAGRVETLFSNGLARVRPRRGYDVVVANILARPLCRLAGDISAAVRPGGTLILSGLLAGQESEVRAAYRVRGLVLVRRIAIDGWHTLILRRGQKRKRRSVAPVKGDDRRLFVDPVAG
jgi:ribosomal protein L11 methyltransferase